MTSTVPASMGGPLSEAEREYRERVEFMSRLGFGDDKTERAARLPEIVDNVEEAFAAAREHDDCPFYCNHCGERLANKDCEECHGAGGHVVQGAYSECSNCGGDMRIHEGCAEKSYADLVAENALLEGQLATAQAETTDMRAALHRRLLQVKSIRRDGHALIDPMLCTTPVTTVEEEIEDARLWWTAVGNRNGALGLDGGDPDER